MTIRFTSVRLDVVTADEAASYTTRFGPGLNVIEAPNSWGKSTLIQSLVYGLGLEGSFSTSHLSPLGEAMTSSIDLGGRRQAVVDSSVTLVIENDRGQFLRTKRWAQSLERQRHLIQTWEADSEEALDRTERVDRYVREPGAAVREMGFHHKLAEFIGWSLPTVPSFNGGESPLYLEVLFPMFYVEQKYGWSGLAPRIPTNFQIQSAYRRAAEFVLGLSALERTKLIERERQSLTRTTAELRTTQDGLSSQLTRNGWRLSSPIPAKDNDQAVLDETHVETLIEVDAGNDNWVPVSSHIADLTERLRLLQATAIENAGSRTAEAQKELRTAEKQVDALGARAKQYQELLEATQAEHSLLEERLSELNADRERLVDIAKLERLGSDLSLSSLAEAHCPTCAQSLDATHVATGIVLDVATNTKLVASERLTVDNLLEAASNRVRAIDGRLQIERSAVKEARLKVRALKDELTGPTNAPSVQQVRDRLVLENQIAASQSSFELAAIAVNEVSGLLGRVAVIERNIRALRREDADQEDLATVRQFGREFQASLHNFAFSSLPVEELSISPSTLLPEHDGFELTFDINHGLSASDTVRAKWAFYAALSRVCAASTRSHPLGTLIMDEPRQQEAALGSVTALYRELSLIGEDQQVIVASSADRSDLEISLQGLRVNRITTDRAHILSL